MTSSRPTGLSVRTTSPQHYLVIGEPDDMGVPDWTIEHPESCPREERHEFGDPQCEVVTFYDCPVGQGISNDGIDAFGYSSSSPEWPLGLPKTPGKYAVEAWGEKYWTDYGWEYDGGIRLIDEATEVRKQTKLTSERITPKEES